MRLSSLCFLVVWCCAISEAQNCGPGPVENITLDSNYFLRWSRAINKNNCLLYGYVVNVYDLEDNTEFQLLADINTTSYNVSFLDRCTTYTFEVRALTKEHVLGPSSVVQVTTNPSPNMNLTLNLTKSGYALLTWNLYDYAVVNCVSYYRVVYWDHDNNTPIDTYVYSRNFSIANTIPCMSYNVRVSAIIANPDLEGPVSETVVLGAAVAPRVPRLVNMSTTSDSVTMFWKLPTYEENRCTLTKLLLVTAGLPSNNSVVDIPIADDSLRSDVNVTIDRLSSNSVYQTLVSLWNFAGASRNVSVSYQTTEDLYDISYE